MNAIVIALVFGITFGAGVWFVWQGATRPRQRVATVRVAPYVSDVSMDAHTVATTSLASRPSGAALVRLASRVSRGSDLELEKLLRQAGRLDGASEWRTTRVLWCLWSTGAGLALGTVYGASVASLGAGLGLVALCGVVGWIAPMWLLRRAARARMRDLEDEMSAGLEMLSLCVSAGEDLVVALARVSEMGTGPFSAVLRESVQEISLGMPVATALEKSAREVDLPTLSRVIEHLTATLERGTPVTDVLAAQIADLREETKRALIESAGRNEVIMLVPLVFLILPVTIAFAVFPGLIAIQSGL